MNNSTHIEVMTYCAECGVKNEESSRFCQNCGAKIEAPAKNLSYQTQSTPTQHTSTQPTQANPPPQYSPQPRAQPCGTILHFLMIR